MSRVKGVFLCAQLCDSTHLFSYSVLEYLSREDAERAVKELDGKDLRGQPVRVVMDAEVRFFFTI